MTALHNIKLDNVEFGDTYTGVHYKGLTPCLHIKSYRGQDGLWRSIFKTLDSDCYILDTEKFNDRFLFGEATMNDLIENVITKRFDEVDLVKDLLFYNPRYKTELCKFFADGKCIRGNKCGYAHGADELQIWCAYCYQRGHVESRCSKKMYDDIYCWDCCSSICECP